VLDGRTARGRIPDALMRTGVRRPGLTLLFWAVVCVAMVPGVARLQIDTSTDSVLDRVDPAWQTYQQSQDMFGGDEILVVAFTGAVPFDPGVLDKLERLSELAADLDGVRRVDSLSTVPIVRVDAAGDLDLRAATADTPSLPTTRSRHVADRLRGDRIAPRNLVSGDGKTVAVNLVLYRDTEARHAELLSELHAIVDPMGGVLSGVPVFRVAANERTQAEILAFAPLTAGLIAAFLWFVFHAARVVVIGVAPGVIGCWILIGAMGYLGAPLGITTMVLPSIVLALGCAYAMHLLAAASQATRSGGAGVSRDALAAALARVTLPVALSGLTTVVGFVSITVVHIEAVRNTGGFGAIGVLVVTAACLTLVPAAVAWRPLPTPPPRGFPWVQNRIAPRLVAFVVRRRRGVIVGWMLITLLVGFGALRIEIETDATRWLPPGHPVRDSYESIRAALSGISPMNVVIEAPEGQSVLEPAILAAIDGLSAHLQTLDEVGRTLSIADPLRQLHGEMLGDPSQPLPDGEGLTEQYMLLLESVESIDDLITPDHRAANVMIRADDNGSARLAHVADVVDAWWTMNGPPSVRATTTGIMYEFARAEDEIAYGQLRGLAVALAVISGTLFAIFRWPRLALVALIPNALPIVMVFGGLGLFGIPLDAGTVLIGALAIGIAVDDTIHVATEFYARIAKGHLPRPALDQTFESVLPAVMGTTAMIAAAFFVLGFSEFTITRNLGLLTGGIMLLCLLADITLLPALLLGMPSPPLAAMPRGEADRVGKPERDAPPHH
jgi:predicted RND superfamily exporter protein